MTTLSLRAHERSSYRIDVDFLDISGNAAVPLTATWTLKDALGNVVNSRSAVSIDPLASSVSITLSGNDLAITTSGNLVRVITIDATYSEGGVNLPLRDQASFYIEKDM
jgi:hypothetical protein